MSSSAQAKQIYPYASFLCTLQVRFLLTPFPIVSVAVWITVFTRFYRCWIYFNRLQNLNGAKLFGIWIIERTSNTNKVYRGYLCCVTMSRLPFIAVCIILIIILYLKLLSAAFFGVRESPRRTLWLKVDISRWSTDWCSDDHWYREPPLHHSIGNWNGKREQFYNKIGFLLSREITNYWHPGCACLLLLSVF